MLFRILQKLQEKKGEGASKDDLPKTMIFANTAAAAQTVFNALIAEGYKAVPFHKEVGWVDR